MRQIINIIPTMPVRLLSALMVGIISPIGPRRQWYDGAVRQAAGLELELGLWKGGQAITLDAALLQWLVNQGTAVFVLVAGIAILGKKLDAWNSNVEQLTVAVNSLQSAVLAHMPPGR